MANTTTTTIITWRTAAIIIEVYDVCSVFFIVPSEVEESKKRNKKNEWEKAHKNITDWGEGTKFMLSITYNHIYIIKFTHNKEE